MKNIILGIIVGLVISQCAFASPLREFDESLLSKKKQKVKIRKSLEVDSQRHAILDFDLTPNQVDGFISFLRAFNHKSDKPLYITIDSRGGYFFSALKVIAAIQTLKTKTKVICIADHNAMSGGLYILSFCSEKYARPYTYFMMHSPQLTITSSGRGLQKIGREVYLKYLSFEKQLAANFGFNFKDYMYVTEGDLFFTSKFASQYRIIDGIVVNINYTNFDESDLRD